LHELGLSLNGQWVWDGHGHGRMHYAHYTL
jgi:hypothetical protein